MKKTRTTEWTVEMHRTALNKLNKEITTKNFSSLLKEIATEIGVKASSLKPAISNYKFIVTGKGLKHTSAAQEQAVKEFIEVNGTKLFKIL
jgi:hypothetical protein